MACAAEEPVSAWTAVDSIRVAARLDKIFAGAAEVPVTLCVTETVSVIVANDVVGAEPAEDPIRITFAIKAIISCGAAKRVAPVIAAKLIGVGAA